jgi:hypothetical protein
MSQNYTDDALQKHELEYWVHRNYPNKHVDFYNQAAQSWFQLKYLNL